MKASPLVRLGPPGVAAAPQEPVDVVELSQAERPRPPRRSWLPAAGFALAAASALAGLAAPAQAGIPGLEPPFSQTGDDDPLGFSHHHGHQSGNWDQRNLPGGWFIPRNTNPTPVKPRFAFDIPEGTADLGPVRILDNTRGKLQAVRLQWPAEDDARARSAHEAMFRDLMTAMDADVRFEVVAEAGGAADLRRFLDEWGVTPERVTIHSLSLRSSREEFVQGLSMWSRDNAVTLTRLEDGSEVLLLPRSFRDDGQVDAYLNRVILQASGAAPALLGSRNPDLVVRRSSLFFEGGDVIANGRHVLVSGATISENVRELKLTREEVLQRFAAEFGVEVIPVDPEPDFHIDMGIGFLDDHTVTVADPRLALEFLSDGLPAKEVAALRERTAELDLTSKYDKVAQLLNDRGYTVLRLPNLAGKSLQSPYLTYQNVLLESYSQDGQTVKKVYMPVYGLPELDAQARQLYESQGFKVVPVSAALLSTRLGGGVRCAVGELDVLN